MRITFKPDRPITQQEKELLIIKRIELIDINKDYAIELFETYYKVSANDMGEDKYLDWLKYSKTKKENIVKYIIKQEDNAFTQFAMRTYKFNLNKQLKKVYELKVNQLEEYDIR